MRISDWSSDVCSSDLWQELVPERIDIGQAPAVESLIDPPGQHVDTVAPGGDIEQRDGIAAGLPSIELGIEGLPGPPVGVIGEEGFAVDEVAQCTGLAAQRSEEHTSELQSLMRHSYAVFCLKKKKTNIT